LNKLNLKKKSLIKTAKKKVRILSFLPFFNSLPFVKNGKKKVKNGKKKFNNGKKKYEKSKSINRTTTVLKKKK
jgi:hypothetical protein